MEKRERGLREPFCLSHSHLGHAHALRALAREEEGLRRLVVRELGVGGGLMKMKGEW